MTTAAETTTECVLIRKSSMSSPVMYNVCAVRSLFAVYFVIFLLYKKRSVYIRRPLYYYARQPSSPYQNNNNMLTTRQYDILGIYGYI